MCVYVVGQVRMVMRVLWRWEGDKLSDKESLTKKIYVYVDVYVCGDERREDMK